MPIALLAVTILGQLVLCRCDRWQVFLLQLLPDGIVAPRLACADVSVEYSREHGLSYVPNSQSAEIVTAIIMQLAWSCDNATTAMWVLRSLRSLTCTPRSLLAPTSTCMHERSKISGFSLQCNQAAFLRAAIARQASRYHNKRMRGLLVRKIDPLPAEHRGGPRHCGLDSREVERQRHMQ